MRGHDKLELAAMAPMAVARPKGSHLKLMLGATRLGRESGSWRSYGRKKLDWDGIVTMNSNEDTRWPAAKDHDEGKKRKGVGRPRALTRHG